MRAVVFTGGGDCTDPWHPFAETAAELAGLAREAGFEVEVLDRIENLRRSAPADVAIVNAGNGMRPTADDDALRDALLVEGRPLFVVHTAANLFADERWERAVGGLWVDGLSFHPPRGDAHVRLDPTHPLGHGIRDFILDDERYTDLRVADDIAIAAWHEHEGVRHPLVWTREDADRRVAFDALGHDAASYRSPEHRELVRRSLAWLTA